MYGDTKDSTTASPSTPTTETASGGKVAQHVVIAGGTVTIDETTLATAAKQDTGNTSLASILAKLTADPATQTTAAAILAKIVAAPALEGGNIATLAGIVSAGKALVTETSAAAILAASPLGQALAAASRPVVLTAIQIAQLAQDATLTGRFPTGTVPADGESNSTAIATMSRILSRLQGYNGTTWDMLRTALTTPSATLTGLLTMLPWAIYNATPTSRTEAQGGPLQADIKGNLNSNLGTLLYGEDSSGVGTAGSGVMAVTGQYSYAYISTQTTTVVKSGAGILRRLVISATALGVVTIYDNTAGSGTVIWTQTMPASVLSSIYVVTFDIKFATGLTIVTATATQNIAVAYR